MEKENGVKVVVAEEDGAKKVVAEEDAAKKVVAEEDAAKKAVAGAPEEEESPAAVCYKKMVGEEATFVESAKDYLKQLKDTTAETHWTCIKNRVRAAGEYVSQKTSSVFDKQKVEPEVKDETPEKAAKPAPAAVESH